MSIIVIPYFNTMSCSYTMWPYFISERHLMFDIIFIYLKIFSYDIVYMLHLLKKIMCVMSVHEQT